MRCDEAAGVTYVLVVLCLIASSYVYEALHQRNWAKAVERSWFQFVAVMCVWLVQSGARI
jgi:hypothetical protein